MALLEQINNIIESLENYNKLKKAKNIADEVIYN